MQCFQKDPNLRVSARKLLRHPWIVNASRSDSIVRTKPTEYEEAVKSVQEWNEALRSPNATLIRKPSKSGYKSPTPAQKGPIPPVREPLTGLNTNLAEKYRSREESNNDNWDDDFDSEISPSALKQTHLKHYDNFGGLLSSEKLKAYALETVMDGDSLDHSFGSSGTVRHTPSNGTDPNETIRPRSRRLTEEENNPPKYRRRHRRRPSPSSGLKPGHLVDQITTQGKPVQQPRPSLYKESSDEDYSDLIIANDDVLENKLTVTSVSPFLNVMTKSGSVTNVLFTGSVQL